MMSIKLSSSLHSLAATALLACAGSVAAIQPAFAEVFHVSGTYNDGGTFLGSFNWDGTTATQIDITTKGGTKYEAQKYVDLDLTGTMTFDVLSPKSKKGKIIFRSSEVFPPLPQNWIPQVSLRVDPNDSILYGGDDNTFITTGANPTAESRLRGTGNSRFAVAGAIFVASEQPATHCVVVNNVTYGLALVQEFTGNEAAIQKTPWFGSPELAKEFATASIPLIGSGFNLGQGFSGTAPMFIHSIESNGNVGNARGRTDNTVRTNALPSSNLNAGSLSPEGLFTALAAPVPAQCP